MVPDGLRVLLLIVAFMLPFAAGGKWTIGAAGENCHQGCVALTPQEGWCDAESLSVQNEARSNADLQAIAESLGISVSVVQASGLPTAPMTYVDGPFAPAEGDPQQILNNVQANSDCSTLPSDARNRRLCYCSTPPPCDVSGVFATGAASPPCEEGTSIESSSNCTVVCLTGYIPSTTHVFCFNGTLENSIRCDEAPCTTENISNTATVPCSEGSFIPSGSTCTVQCAEGYEPSRSTTTLTCHLGTFDPPDFQCVEPSCASPVVQNAGTPSCVEGSPVPGGGVCTTTCASGYYPSVASLSCSFGALTPPSFECLERPCAAPSGVANAASPSCAQGPQVQSGGACTARCASGYQASQSSLSCTLGALSPSTFTCSELPCSAPSGISNAASPPCAEGAQISSGEQCTAECAGGYEPSASTLNCSLGALSPASFECTAIPCTAPNGIPNAATPACTQGSQVASGGSCTSACNGGYEPSVASLDCSFGTLSPASFVCIEMPCSAPSGIANAASPSCSEGASIDSGQQCTTECANGYSSSVDSLNCSLGALSPAAFACSALPCQSPSSITYFTSHAGTSSVPSSAQQPCSEGDAVQSGEACTATCAVGFEPSAPMLSCNLGVLTPTTFTCSEQACTAPSGVANAAAISCTEGSTIESGSSCTPACDLGYYPSEAFLNCSMGVLENSTFVCLESPCNVPTSEFTCAEGPVISSGERCTVQCLQGEGYSVSAATIECTLGQFNPSGSCLAPCLLPTMIDNASGPCLAVGNHTFMLHDQSCSAECEESYIPSASELACNDGVLSPPTFNCLGPCVVPAGMANGAADSCVEPNNGTILHGTRCTARCAPGYVPSVAVLTCSDAVLSPSTFSCREGPCDVAVSMDPTAFGCAEGARIDSGQSCTVQCVPGYTASVASLTCSLGAFAPLGAECLPPCPVPIVDNADADPCGLVNRSYLLHGETCSVTCGVGYTPSTASMFCNSGVLSPATFNCSESVCAAPADTGNASACLEGPIIQSRSVCTTQCVDGYVPSVVELSCALGQLAPRTFECIPPCVPPVVHHGASTTCAEAMNGGHVEHGGVCTPQCETGYTASVASLNCSFGLLGPSTFQCFPDCELPVGIENAAPRACLEISVPRGGICTPQCDEGYTPSITALECPLDQVELVPSNFTCLPGCTLPTVEFAAPEMCMGLDNSSLIHHGVDCYVHCKNGYVPTAEALHCDLGVLSPPNVSCAPDLISCDVPLSIPNSAVEPCAEVPKEPGHVRHMGSCTSQCAEGYTPSARTLTCTLGQLIPATFACIDCAEVKFLLNDTANPSVQPGSVRGTSASLENMWCYYSCGPLAVYYGAGGGLEWIAQGLFRHLPCAEISAWHVGEGLARADILVVTTASFKGLRDSILLDSGFRGAIVLVDTECGALDYVAPTPLRCWVDRTLYLGADRAAASAYSDFLEVPPGALELLGRNDGRLEAQLAGLRSEQREPLMVATKTKFLAYLANECDPAAEKLFDLIYERLRGFGAVEALGLCHGSHPEAARASCDDVCVGRGEGNVAAFAPFRFVLVVEPSAGSQRRCPKSVHSVVIDALSAGAVPVYRGPDEATMVLNNSALISVPPWIPEEAGVGMLRAAASADGSDNVAASVDSEVLLAMAPSLSPHARELWFAWDESLRGARTEFGTRLVSLLTPIMRGSPSWQCWEYQISKRLY